MTGFHGKRVLVTGADGFIGSHLAERLVREGAKVRAFVYYNSFNTWGWLDTLPEEIKGAMEVHTGDIRDDWNVRQAVRGMEVVYHLAALIAIPYSYRSPESYVRTNVEGTLNVLRAAADEKVGRFIHTSTSEVYGTARYTPMDEDHPLQGQSPYSASKIGADMMAESFYRSFSLPVTIIRPFNTFGPRQSARAVIPTIMTALLKGETTLRLGSLSPVRDFNYVADTVEGFIRGGRAEEAVGEVIQLGTGRGVTIGELAGILMKLTGKHAEIVTDEERVRPEGSEVMALIASPGKAHKLLGWKPSYDLETGLGETIAWMGSHLARYKPEIYNV